MGTGLTVSSKSVTCTQNHVTTKSISVTASISNGYITYVITHNYNSGNWGTEHTGYSSWSTQGFPYSIEISGSGVTTRTITAYYGTYYNPSSYVSKTGYSTDGFDVSSTIGRWYHMYNGNAYSHTGSTGGFAEGCTVRDLRYDGGTAKIEVDFKAHTYTVRYYIAYGSGSSVTYYDQSCKYGTSYSYPYYSTTSPVFSQKFF